MKIKTFFKYIPFIIILLLEILSWFLDNDDIKYTTSHLIVFALIYMGYQIVSINESNQKVITSLKTTISLLSKREVKNSNLLNLINYGYSNFDPKDFPKIWADLMWNSKSEFISSNYIHPKHLWSNKFSRATLLIQQAKIANEGVSMSRLFIYETKDELTQLMEPIKINYEAGLKVYYISKKEIYNTSHLKYCLNKDSNDSIKTLAFNLIDNTSLLLYDLDDDRNIKSFKLIIDDKVYDRYKRFYNDVIKSSTKYRG